MANYQRKEVSHKANSNFMYGYPVPTLKKNLIACIKNSNYKFDVKGIIGNDKTNKYLNYIGKENADKKAKEIIRRVEQKQAELTPRVIDGEVDTFEIKGITYFKAGLVKSRTSRTLEWLVILHD